MGNKMLIIHVSAQSYLKHVPITFRSRSNLSKPIYQDYAALQSLPPSTPEFGTNGDRDPDGFVFVYPGELFCRAKWNKGDSQLCSVSDTLNHIRNVF
jgi:hypothetical protein